MLAPPDGGPELGLGMVIVRSFCRPKLKRMADIIKSKAIVMSARDSTRRRYLRFVAEAKVCSYCGEDLDGHGPRMLYDNVRLPLVEGKHHGLCYNRGVWWYRPMGPCAGDVWARFYSWREECIPDNNQYHKTAAVVLHRCRRCFEERKILMAAADEILELRFKKFTGAAAVAPLRCAEDGVICSYCGGPDMSSTEPRKIYYEKTDDAQWHETLSFNGGVWWMQTTDRHMWRRCHWWDEFAAGGERTLVFSQCHFCGAESRILSDAITLINCKRVEVGDARMTSEPECGDV